jgi:hypothetical protein
MISKKEVDERTKKLINNLIAKEKAKEVKNNKSWISSVEDAKALLSAIKKDKTEVTLSHGTFNITSKIHNKENVWWVSPTDGTHVPCGYFTPFKLNSIIAAKEVK